MKKRINLLVRRSAALIPEAVLERIRLYGTIASVILFVIFLAFIGLQIQKRQEYNALLDKKKELLTFFINNKEDQAKYTVFTQRNDTLKKDLKDDADFLPYYRLLNNLLSTSSNSAILESMTLDKAKKTEFSVRFLTYQPAYNFIHFIETNDSFLNSFTDLTLQNFTLTDKPQSSSQQGYELKFAGQFKAINAPITK